MEEKCLERTTRASQKVPAYSYSLAAITLDEGYMSNERWQRPAKGKPNMTNPLPPPDRETQRGPHYPEKRASETKGGMTPVQK